MPTGKASHRGGDRVTQSTLPRIHVSAELVPPSEDHVPTRARWWIERTERYAAGKTGVDEVWRRRTARVLRNLAVPFGPNGSNPPHWVRLGFSPPSSAGGVTRAMIEALRDTPHLAETSRQNWTSRLRGFLAAERNPLAADPELWHMGKPVARKRPYLSLASARAVLNAAEDRERVVIALGLFNGLRTIEVFRLKVGDLSLEEKPPVMWVLGKGRRGGKPRRIAVNPLAYGELLPFIAGKRPADRVYPGTYSSIDKDWRRAQRRAGLTPVGTHALRRSFGRLSHDAGTPIPEIRAVYGHASPVTTTEYIGIEEMRMAAGLAKMAAYFEGAA